MPRDSIIQKTGTVVAKPTIVGCLETTRCLARWHELDHTTIDVTVEGYIRNPFRAVQMISRGWQSVQADGDAAPKPALVIYVVEVVSAYPGMVPRGFFTMDNFVAPPELSKSADNASDVVFFGLEPGSDVNSPPAAFGKMRRTRVSL